MTFPHLSKASPSLPLANLTIRFLLMMPFCLFANRVDAQIPAPTPKPTTPASPPQGTVQPRPTAVKSTPCPTEVTNEQGVDGWDALEKGEQFAADGKYEEALTWYRKAAAAGNGNGAYEAGALYEAGYRLPSTRTGTVTRSNFVGPDLAEAFCWYKKAADDNYTPAMSELAKFYIMGSRMKDNPVAANTPEALRLTETAAKLGDVEAKLSLAQAYLQGSVVPADFNEFKKRLEAADAAFMKMQQKCESNKQTMKSQFPLLLQLSAPVLALLRARDIKRVELIAARGEGEYVCELTLAPPPATQPESPEEKRRRENDTPSWAFTVNEISGRPLKVRRETVGKAAEKMQVAMQANVRLSATLANLKRSCGNRCVFK